MQQAHLFISGKVQGVGYRYFVKSNAKKLGLTGWVRNTEDGGVEAVLAGTQELIEQMIGICRQGPPLSEVEHLGFEWEEGEESFEGFTIK